MSQEPFEIVSTVHSEEFKKCASVLKLLPADCAQAIQEKVMKQAMEPVFHEAVRRAPVGATGKLSNGIRLRFKKFPDQTYYAVVVSLEGYSHLVEKGHRLVRGSKKSGKQHQVGSVPPHPFMLPAWISKEREILQIAETELVKAIEGRAIRA